MRTHFHIIALTNGNSAYKAELGDKFPPAPRNLETFIRCRRAKVEVVARVIQTFRFVAIVDQNVKILENVYGNEVFHRGLSLRI